MNLRGSPLASVPVVGHVELAISSGAVKLPASIALLWCVEGKVVSRYFAHAANQALEEPASCEEQGTPTQYKREAQGDHDTPGWWYAAACFSASGSPLV